MANVFPELKGPALQASNRAIGEAIRRIKARYGLSDEEIVVRNLSPQDLTAATTQKSWTFTTVGTGNTATRVVNIQVADFRYVIINGISMRGALNQIATSITTPTDVNQIEITRSGSLARIWNIQMAQNLGDGTMYFDDPVIIDENNNLAIDLYAATATAKPLGFEGTVVEKQGIVIGC